MFFFFFISLYRAFEPFFSRNSLQRLYIPVMSYIFVLINATVFLCEYCCRGYRSSEQQVLLCKFVLDKVFSRLFLPASTPPYCPRDPPRPIPYCLESSAASCLSPPRAERGDERRKLVLNPNASIFHLKGHSSGGFVERVGWAATGSEELWVSERLFTPNLPLVTMLVTVS